MGRNGGRRRPHLLRSKALRINSRTPRSQWHRRTPLPELPTSWACSKTCNTQYCSTSVAQQGETSPRKVVCEAGGLRDRKPDVNIDREGAHHDSSCICLAIFGIELEISEAWQTHQLGNVTARQTFRCHNPVVHDLVENRDLSTGYNSL